MAVTKSWQEWVNENLSRDCDPAGIVKILGENGFTESAIKSMLGASYPSEAKEHEAITDSYGGGSNGVVHESNEENGDISALHLKQDSLRDIKRALSRLNPKHKTIERRHNLSRQEFLEQYYSANRPVVLTGLMEKWAAPERWTPEYLKTACGTEMVEIMAQRDSNALYEIQDAPHRRNIRFGEFIDMVNNGGESNDYYLTARNNFFARPGAKALLKDIAPLPPYLRTDNPGDGMYLWYGPKGTITPLHHDSMNIFMAQVQGRKRVRLIPSDELDLVYNHYAVYSEVDLLNPDYAKFPRFRDVTMLDVELAPGEFLFLPVGWWHHVASLDRSITVSFNNFAFPNNYNWVDPVHTKPQPPEKKENGAAKQNGKLQTFPENALAAAQTFSTQAGSNLLSTAMTIDKSAPEGVLVIHDYIGKELCKTLTDYADAQTFTDLDVMDYGKTTKKAVATQKDEGRITHHVDIDGMAGEILNLFNDIYCNRLAPFYNVNFEWYERPQILRYPAGGRYNQHADADHWLPDTKTWTRVQDRDYSVLLYLNDAYEGGEIQLILQNYTVKPKPGMLLAFPSDHRYLHAALPTTSGIRYVIVSWAAVTGTKRVRPQPPHASVFLRQKHS